MANLRLNNLLFMYKDGVYDISNDDYHNDKAISRSALMKIKKSPYHYWYEHINPDYIRGPETSAMITGNLLHCLVLEPNKYREQYIVAPKVDKRTKAGKIEWQEFVELAGDKTVLTPEQLELGMMMASKLQESERVSKLISDAKIEQSIFFTHKATGLQCKARPDAWKDGIISDVKTTMDAGYRSFQQSCYKYGYFLQAGMMKEALSSIGIDMRAFVFLCVENKPPFASGIYTLDEEAIKFGVGLFHHLMEKLKLHLDKNEWPAHDVQTMCLPSYADYED